MAQGSVAHMFERKGEIVLSSESDNEEKVMDLAITAGAHDVINDENIFSVITAHDELNTVANNLCNAGANIDSQKLIYTPKTTASIEDSSIAKQVLNYSLFLMIMMILKVFMGTLIFLIN